MEQPFSTSKVTVEYFDPHDVYKLVKPGLIPRLPLRNLHWQSHAGPLRSIETLHVELIDALHTTSNTLPSRPGTSVHPPASSAGGNDGFTTQALSGSAGGGGEDSFPANPFSPGYGPSATSARRHQIPGLRRTPYLKILFVRCDDNDAYKSSVRAEVRDWIKEHTGPASSSGGASSGSGGGGGSGSGSGSGKKGDARSNNNKGAENHDAFEWLIVHVVVPNTVAATQPRFSSGKGSEGGSDSMVPTKSSTSLWGKTSSTILEKLRSDFNHASSSSSSGSGGSSGGGGNKSAGGYVDRITQIRIGINDVPYDLLPRVVPAVPTGYKETEEEAKAAWADLIDEMKHLILKSFDLRVTQYEEDIKEKDAQRSLPGWNFCTFFILKEGLARGFESVGLVEDSLVGYDELSVGLDAIIKEQAVVADDSPEVPGGSLLPYTEDLKQIAQRAMTVAGSGTMEFEDEEQVDLQAASDNNNDNNNTNSFDDIPISYLKKPYRELILANNVSLFDFRCYIFARQISLLLRLGNAWSTREELVAKLREQQEAILHGVAPRAIPPTQADESEKLSMLAEICKRTLEFIPSVSHVMRRDVIAALMTTTEQKKAAKNKTIEGETQDDDEDDDEGNSNLIAEVAENIVASFAFSVAQQVLAQTLTKALPISPATIAPSVTGGEENGGGAETKAAMPDLKAMIHPARTTSLRVGTAGNRLSSIPSPNFFPGPGDKRRASVADVQDTVDKLQRKAGMEELAARRAELYALSRNILEEAGRKRGWRNGWSSAPVIGDSGLQDASMTEMEEVDLNDDAPAVQPNGGASDEQLGGPQYTLAGLDSKLLRTALDNKDDFYRLYEMLTDKALQHYTVAGLTHSVLAKMSDLAVVKYYLEDYTAAAMYFVRTTPFYGESGWSLLELSMLVMYSHCLRQLERHDEYIRVVLKLLSKAANSEKERLRAKGSLRFGGDVVNDSTAYAEKEAFKGFLPAFLAAAQAFGKDVKHSLQNFCTGIALEGTPVYDDGKDSFALTVKLHSVLADELPVDKAMLRLVTTGGARELWLENMQEDEQEQPLVLRPGRNRMRFRGTAMSPGVYEVDRIQLVSGLLKLNFERQAFVPPSTLANHQHRGNDTVNLRHPYVALFQRADTLDLVVEPSPVVQLDKNNAMDLTLTTGWNEVETCTIRIRSGTGGLRLLTSEAAVIGGKGPTGPQPKTPEPGLFSFDGLAADSLVRLRIPFTTEQDVSSVSVKVEVVYTTTTGGTYTLLKTPSIPLALKLGVNVQDVFKHASLFSRFTVSTSTSSPLRLFSSQLDESEVFEARHGVGVAAPTTNPVIIFPKQPASLLYQIKRKQAAMRITPKMQKTMHLRLCYSVLREEIGENIKDSLTDALKEKEYADGTHVSLWQYSRLVAAVVLERVRLDMTAYDLERVAVLGEVPLGFLAEVKWREEKGFYGMGVVNGEDVAGLLAGFIVGWAKAKRVISAMRPFVAEVDDTAVDGSDGGDDTTDNNVLEKRRSNNRHPRQHTIIIPVDIPSIAVVHTADIRLQRPIPSLVEPFDGYETPVACVNQLLPATLHLKWTRIWDTERIDGGGGEQQQQQQHQAQDGKQGEDGREEGEEEGEEEEDHVDDDDDDDDAEGDEFSYEVNAPGDTWLVGGRKKGHFVIPSGGGRGEAKSSSPINEADIPLVMIPLREGHLPYPSVEVREVPLSSSSSSPSLASGSPFAGGEGGGADEDGNGNGNGNGKKQASLAGHCETDYRNLGETVRVVADRGRVTVSLDASGPGGGPLVLESERVLGFGGPEEERTRPFGRVVA